MIINSTMTVREAALQLPEAIEVFERMKIDYCCAGNRSLSEACTCAGVEFETLERMFIEANCATQENPPIDFSALRLVDVINHIIENHHAYTKAEMARLSPLMDDVISAHEANHPELLQMGMLFRRLCSDVALHMYKEEKIFFPYIIEKEIAALDKEPLPISRMGTANNPIRMMLLEHDTTGELLRALRNRSSDYYIPADASAPYQMLYQGLEELERDLHVHIHLENNILFPRAATIEGA